MNTKWCAFYFKNVNVIKDKERLWKHSRLKKAMEIWQLNAIPGPRLNPVLRGNLPQHNKSHIWQTHSQHHSQWWKTESISAKIRNKKRVPTLTTIIQHSFGSFGHGNQRRKRNKRNPNWKRTKIVSVCRWHDTIKRKSWRCHQKNSRANQWIW